MQKFIPLVIKADMKETNPGKNLEKELLSNLIEGDRSAFSIVFSAYYKDLVMFAASFTNDQDSAEEIAKDTFVKLWEDHKTIKIEISLKSYLLKIVRNKCIDWYRHEKIKHNHTDFILGNSPCYIYDTDNYILYSELQEQLEAALDKLPAEISEAFRMNRNKGLKYQEIADLAGVSVRTIEVRIGKALHMLRSHLKEYFSLIITILSLIQNR